MKKREIWRDIAGCEGKYRVSNLGRVLSVRRKIHIFRYGKHSLMNVSGRVLKPQNVRHGYQLVHVGRLMSVHRLVAKAFLKNPLNKKQVNHKDGNKKNNKASNLEWCTPSENVQHALRTGLWYSSLTDSDIRCIRGLSSRLTRKEIGKIYGMSRKAISSIILMRTYKSVI